MGSFIFKWPHPEANDVHVTGTFDDWGKSVQLNKVGDIWEKEVDLPNTEKILYKFVVNDQWIIDPEAPQEDDGHGNINNVLHPHDMKTSASTAPGAVTSSSAAPTSTTAALAGQVPLEDKKEAGKDADTSKSSPPGSFPETPANEEHSFGVNPLPPTEGASNPVNVPAGEKPPASERVTSNSIHSAVTTSQGDYEKAGSGIPFIGGALAALGLGGGAAAAAKHEDDKQEKNLIPESSLPMGETAGAGQDAGPLMSSAGAGSTTAALAGQVPLEGKSTSEPVAAVPEVVKESIAEAHTSPEAATSTEAVKEKSAMEKELLTTVGGASSSSQPVAAVPEVVKESMAEAHAAPEAATSSEVVEEKSAVEQELLKKVPETEESGEPAPTLAAATSATAPAATGETSSSTAPGTSTLAAAALADGGDGEKIEAPQTSIIPEKTEADNTEYAPPAHTSAPGVSDAAAAAVSDGTEDPTLMDEPAVQMMNKNDAEATGATSAVPTTDGTTEPTTAAATARDPAAAMPESTAHDTTTTGTSATTATATKKDEPKAATTPAATTGATSTPQKPTSSTPTSTPGSTATKEKKKKNRVSSFFKKIFD